MPLQSGGGVQLDTGRVIVQFGAGVPAADRAAVHRGFGAARIDTIPALGIEVVELPNAAATRAVAAAYNRHPLVTFAEPDALAPLADGATLTANDELYALQWQHRAIDSPGGWAVRTGDSALLTTVCDTGVSPTHPDLVDNLRGDLGFNTVDDSTDWGPKHWHGTFVAGMIAAVGNNSIGVAGGAWQAGIIPVRISNSGNGSAFISDMAQCIVYGADHDSTSINLSYGTFSGGGVSQTILEAAIYANATGSVLFVSAGDVDSDPSGGDDPESIFYVAATTDAGEAASFSNHGAYVDIAAPGEDVVSTIYYRPFGGDSYAYASGTSFSSPLTAGVALLVANALGITPGGPSDAACIRAALTAGAVDAGAAGEDDIYGAGILNSHGAVHGASCGAAALEVTTTSLAGGAVNASYSETLAATGGTGPYTWAIVDDGGALPGELSLNTLTGEIWGTPTTVETANFTVEVTDSAASPATDTQALSIEVAAAPPLAVTTTSLADGTEGVEYSATLGATGGTGPYTWAIVDDGGALPGELSLNTLTGEIWGTPTTVETANFTVEVTDSAASPATDTQALSIAVATGGGSVSVASITHAPGGGGPNGDKHLLVTVQLDQSIGGASVSIDLFRDGQLIGSGTATTNASGSVGFIKNNAGSGCFTTVVTGVTGAGVTFVASSNDIHNATKTNDPCP